MESTTTDLTWLCFIAGIVWMMVIMYYGIRSRIKYAKQLFRPQSKATSWLSKLINRKPRTRFTRLEEFYKAITALIQWLQRDGHSGDAQKLEMLMQASWTTDSELLGELMLTLKSLKGNYSPELRKEIAECFEFALHHRKFLGLSDGR